MFSLDRFCRFDQSDLCYAALGHKLNLLMVQDTSKYDLMLIKRINNTQDDPVCRVKYGRMKECDLYNNRAEVTVINGTLIINHVIRADLGNYRLRLSHSDGTETSRDLQVIVEGLDRFCRFDQSDPCYAALGHKLNLLMVLDTSEYDLMLIKRTNDTQDDPVCRVKYGRMKECDLYNNRAEVTVIDGSLIINHVIRADSGNYTLRLSHSDGTETSRDLQVIVEAPIGSVKVSVSCFFNQRSVSCSSEGDQIIYNWTLNGEILKQGLMDGNSRIDLDEGTDGNISCSMKNHISHAQKTISVEPCPGLDRFCRFDQSDLCYAALGHKLNLLMVLDTSEYDLQIIKRIYNTQDDPLCRVKYGRMKECDLYNNRAEVTVIDGTLIINHVTRADSGNYTLRLSHSDGTETSRDLQVIVEGLDRFCRFDQSDPCYAALGHKLNLLMVLDTSEYDLQIIKRIYNTQDDPLCRVKYGRMKECDLYNNRAEVTVINGTVIINHVIRADSGNYTLRLIHSDGTETSRDLQVIVEAPIGPVNVSISFSSNQTSVSCSSEGDHIIYNWTLNGIILEQGPMVRNTTIQLNETSAIGNISCSVKNNVSYGEKTISVKPCPEPTTAPVTSSLTSTVTSTVSSTIQTSDYITSFSSAGTNQTLTQSPEANPSQLCLDRFCRFDQSDPCYAALGDKLNLLMVLDTSEYDLQIIKRIYNTQDDPVCRVKYGRMKECDLYNNRAEVTVINGTVIINHVIRADSGNYTLRLIHSGGTETSRDLQVFVEAPIGSVEVSIICSSSGVMRASCSSEGDQLLYNWTLNGDSLMDGNSSIDLNEGTDGNITCSVKNHVSHGQKTINVKPCSGPTTASPVRKDSEHGMSFSKAALHISLIVLGCIALILILLFITVCHIYKKKQVKSTPDIFKDNWTKKQKQKHYTHATAGNAEIIYADISHEKTSKKGKQCSCSSQALPDADVEYSALKPQKKRKEKKQEEVQYGEVRFIQNRSNAHQRPQEECVYSQSVSCNTCV
ncbi:uncharacterized protein LOC127175754 [Labeo rohita]|uniref:uncharacterized protein LOC127175754 n=1 Tax=Labeo rohita TaxID=84645 RepID=UPI0021E25A78|nr:uncharacterized protein LOC127175754 [Labeo rohita]